MLKYSLSYYMSSECLLSLSNGLHDKIICDTNTEGTRFISKSRSIVVTYLLTFPSPDGQSALVWKCAAVKGTPGKSLLSELKELPAVPVPERPRPAMWFTTASTMILPTFATGSLDVILYQVSQSLSEFIILLVSAVGQV